VLQLDIQAQPLVWAEPERRAGRGAVAWVVPRFVPLCMLLQHDVDLGWALWAAAPAWSAMGSGVVSEPVPARRARTPWACWCNATARGARSFASAARRWARRSPAAIPTPATSATREMNRLFEATTQATDEAIVNAMVGVEIMTGFEGHTAMALPHERLREVLKKYNRLDQ